MRTIVVASSNPHKVEEFDAIFAGLLPGYARFVSLKEAAGGRVLEEPAETGATFEENATIKALSYARQTGLTCLADDSGLEIDALGGRPGVISSHYCTDGREAGMSRGERDVANIERVMKELEGVAAEERTARFRCVIVVAGVGADVVAGVAVECLVRGVFEGRIGMKGEVPRGENGFGYDPVFLVGPRFERTSAEMSAEEKNSVSHRARAAGELARVWGKALGTRH